MIVEFLNNDRHTDLSKINFRCVSYATGQTSVVLSVVRFVVGTTRERWTENIY